MGDVLLAKSTGELLYDHIEKGIEFATIIVDSLAFEQNFKKYLKEEIIPCVALHDVGKACTGFQEALKNNSVWGSKRHEVISCCFAVLIPEISDEQRLAIITHHKRLYTGVVDMGIGDYLDNRQIEAYDEDSPILKSMKKEFHENRKLFKEFWSKLCEKYGWRDWVKYALLDLRQGVGLPQEWLDAEEGTTYCQSAKIDFRRRQTAVYLRGLLKAADHLASGNIQPRLSVSVRDYKVIKYERRCFQNRCFNHGLEGKDLILRAPTGSGKTEAALLWAAGAQKPNSRIFYVLPYTASVNAMHRRLSNIFGTENVGVLHSRAIGYLYQGELERLEMGGQDSIDCRKGAQKRAAVASALAREIYYPIRVCTPHQILRFALNGPGWEYLYLEMQNALFIFDEIHAYEPLITGLTLATVNLLRKMGARFLFISATLPEYVQSLIKNTIPQLAVLQPDPNEKSDREIMNKKRHIINICEGNVFDNISRIVKEANNGRKVLIIVNHVKTAQELFKVLKKEHRVNAFVLHSRFTQEDRNQKEKLLTAEDNPAFVIATQVIEVSLNIDYDVMFTEPAPVDALVQRFGRVNRAGSKPPANIYVFSSQYSPHCLYNHSKVEKTIELLKSINNPVSENDLIYITDEVYLKGYEDEELAEFNKGINNSMIMNFEKDMIAGVHRDWVENIIEGTDGRFDVIPCQLYSEYENRKNKGLWIEADQLLVPLNFNVVRNELNRINKVKDVNVISSRYDREIGLQVDKSDNMWSME